MFIFPSKRQWQNWTLPSKWSYLGGVAGIIALVPILIGLLSPLWTSQSFLFVRPTFYDPIAMQWFFFVDHKGSEPVQNIDVIWNDEAKPFTQHSIAKLHYPEIDPQPTLGPMARGQFPWRSPTPEHEHFTVEISYRGAQVYQDLRIERVENSWAIATRVSNSGPKGQTLLACKDPSFPSELGYEDGLPKCWPDFPRGH